MESILVRSDTGLTLLGGGELGTTDLADALSRAPGLVAADGGAKAALEAGHLPRAVIGDMDSLAPQDQARLPPGVLHPVPEQDSTDFDKVTARIAAPFALGVGFLGLRADHQLANFNTLVRLRALPCLLIGPEDVIFAAPPRLTLALPPGSRVSLFPLAPVSGRSQGLEWPIEGLAMRPDGSHGTSNRVAGGAAGVALAFDAPGMLVILPRASLDPALTALAAAPRWPALAP